MTSSEVPDAEAAAKKAREDKAIASFVRLRSLASTYSYTEDSATFLASPTTNVLKVAYGTYSRLQFLHLRLPAAPKQGKRVPVVVTIHGGFWKRIYGLGYFEPLAKSLIEELGVATCNVEYRRAASEEPKTADSDEFCEDETKDGPEDKGGWPVTAMDVCKAIGFIVSQLADTYGLDTERLVIAGHSAGGHLAGLIPGLACAAYSKDPSLPAFKEDLKSWFGTATDVQIKSAVILAGVMDLSTAHAREVGGPAIPGFMLGATPESSPKAYKMASPSTYLPGVLEQTSFHLVQGTQDDDVPDWNAREFVALARSKGGKQTADVDERVNAVYLDGIGHFEIVDPEEGGEAWKATVESVRAAIGR